jgi:hypothetical protein
LRELIDVDRHLGPLEQAEIRLYLEHRLTAQDGPADRNSKTQPSPKSSSSPPATRAA